MLMLMLKGRRRHDGLAARRCRRVMEATGQEAIVALLLPVVTPSINIRVF
jgi:hypothetical protein